MEKTENPSWVAVKTGSIKCFINDNLYTSGDEIDPSCPVIIEFEANNTLYRHYMCGAWLIDALSKGLDALQIFPANQTIGGKTPKPKIEKIDDVVSNNTSSGS